MTMLKNHMFLRWFEHKCNWELCNDRQKVKTSQGEKYGACFPSEMTLSTNKVR